MTPLRNLRNILRATYALRLGFLARKKHDVRVRKPKKEKIVRFRIRFWKKRSI